MGDLPFETYLVSYPQLVISSGSNMEQNLAKSTSERLDTLRKWVSIATLRSLNISAVPEELQAEHINCKLCDQTSFGILVHTTIPIALVIRVLRHLRSLSEQALRRFPTLSPSARFCFWEEFQQRMRMKPSNKLLWRLASLDSIVGNVCFDTLPPFFLFSR